MSVPLDLRTMPPYGGRRSFLAAPAGWTRVPPDREAPVFAAPAAAVRDAWLRVLARQPRVTVSDGGADPLQVEAVQRSAVFRFPDRITARFIPLADGRSTLAVFSRAVLGRYDFGVNRRRVLAWLAALREEVGPGS